MNPDEVVERLAQALAGTPRLVALLLVGSTARGDRHEKSDIDFLALIDDAVPWPLDVRDGGRRSWLDASGFEIEVGYSSVARIRSRALAEADAGIPHRLQLFTEGRLVARGGPEYDRLMSEMIRRYEAGPPLLTEQDRRWEGFDIWCRLRGIEGRLADSVTAGLLAFETFEHLVRLLFRLAPDWQPRTHQLVNRLMTVDGWAAEWAEEFVAATNVRDQLTLLHAMATRLEERHGLPLTGNYTSGPSG